MAATAMNRDAQQIAELTGRLEAERRARLALESRLSGTRSAMKRLLEKLAAMGDKQALRTLRAQAKAAPPARYSGPRFSNTNRH